MKASNLTFILLLALLPACGDDSNHLTNSDARAIDAAAGDASGTDGSHADPSPLDYGPRNTILVTMPNGAKVSWEELAFLAAVPAGMKVNDGKPSVLAVPPNLFRQTERKFYDTYFDPYHAEFIYNIGPSSGHEREIQLTSSSLDTVTCELARVWRRRRSMGLGSCRSGRTWQVRAADQSPTLWLLLEPGRAPAPRSPHPGERPTSRLRCDSGPG